jgi:hypothetical protein
VVGEAVAADAVVSYRVWTLVKVFFIPKLLDCSLQCRFENVSFYLNSPTHVVILLPLWTATTRYSKQFQQYHSDIPYFFATKKINLKAAHRFYHAQIILLFKQVTICWRASSHLNCNL